MKFCHYKNGGGQVLAMLKDGGGGEGEGHKHFGGSFYKGIFSHAEDEGQTVSTTKRLTLS